jgi:hypothetical protein
MLRHKRLDHGYRTVYGLPSPESWYGLESKPRKGENSSNSNSFSEQLQQTLILNPHISSRKEENARKLKQNEFLPVMRGLHTACEKVGNFGRVNDVINEGWGLYTWSFLDSNILMFNADDSCELMTF